MPPLSDREPVLWLIDAGYLLNAQRSVANDFNFDYVKLRERLEQEAPIWRAYYLNSTQSTANESQEGFHNFLRSAPPYGPKIITKLYPLKPQPVDRAYCDDCQRVVGVSCSIHPSNHGHRLSREIQKGVDVGLATLALTLTDQYQTLMLSSGDSDFADMVEYLSQHGKRIELAVFRQGVASELQARADQIHWIDSFADEVRKDQ